MFYLKFGQVDQVLPEHEHASNFEIIQFYAREAAFALTDANSIDSTVFGFFRDGLEFLLDALLCGFGLWNVFVLLSCSIQILVRRIEISETTGTTIHQIQCRFRITHVISERVGQLQIDVRLDAGFRFLQTYNMGLTRMQKEILLEFCRRTPPGEENI